MNLRLATPDDATAILAIYAPIVRDTAISFELVPPEPHEMARRIAAVQDLAPWVVAEVEGAVRAYAYATEFRARPAYRWTLETAVYVAAGARGRGLGRSLYARLLELLRAQGFLQAVGGITLPNPASVRLHESLGFRSVGTFPDVGFKLGAWHAVGFWAKDLAAHGSAPAEPQAFASFCASLELARILAPPS